MEDVAPVPLLDRAAEIDSFVRFVEDAIHLVTAKRILNVWGAGGVGKTRLLQIEFMDRAVAHGWHYIYMPQHNHAVPLNSLDGYMNNLEAAWPEIVDANDTLLLSSVERARAYAQNIKQYIDNHPIVPIILVIDQMTRIEEWFEDFEKYFLAHVYKHVVVIIGSRSEIHLDRFELRLQLQVRHLDHLEAVTDAEAASIDATLTQWVEAHVGETAPPNAVSHLRQLYFGNPRALTSVLTAVAAHPTMLVEEDFAELRLQLAADIVNAYGNVHSAPPRVDQVHQALREIAIFRRFDVLILQKALTSSPDAAVAATFNPYKDNSLYFSGLAQSMVSTLMIEWDNDKLRGFVMDYSYRRIIAAGLRTQNTASYMKRHADAIEQYVRLLRSERGEAQTRNIYIIELIYHIASADPARAPERLRGLETYVMTMGESLPSDVSDDVSSICKEWSVPNQDQRGVRERYNLQDGEHHIEDILFAREVREAVAQHGIQLFHI